MSRILALLLTPVAAFAQKPVAPATPKIQALIITGQDAHPWRDSTPYIRQVLEQTGRFEARVVEEFRYGNLAILQPYDVVIMNYSDEKLQIPSWTDSAKSALLDYVRSGKGLVAYHHAAASFQTWPEYEKLVGCIWRTCQSHHAPVHDYKIDIRDPEHPIMRGIGALMAQSDELYAGLLCEPAGTIHVLATGFDDRNLYRAKDLPKLPEGPSRDEPLIWTLTYGSGRLFANMLGNDMRAVHTPGFVTTLVRGAEWAATGTVTIPVPAEIAK